jgi:hypothetical protein
MISPQGDLYQVPEEETPSALEQGFKLMTDERMATMYNRMFLAQKFFEQKHPKITNWRLPRGRGRW